MIECDPQPSYHFEALVGMCAPIWCQGTTAETAPVELKRLIELVDLGTGVAECKYPSTVAAVTVGLDVPGMRGRARWSIGEKRITYPRLT